MYMILGISTRDRATSATAAARTCEGWGMSDIEKIVVTAAFTLLGGVIVYVVGQFLSKAFIDPLQNLRKTIGETRFNLTFHVGVIHSPIGRASEKSDNTQDALMKSS
jgi:hypothetical protein